MNSQSSTTSMAGQTEMPVHETLNERLENAESADERSEIIRTWTQEEIDHKREIYELLARS